MWQDQPMPVTSSRFGQPVGHVDSHPIAFAKAQRRAWHLAIEGISVDVAVWQYLSADHRCLQIEHLDAIFQARLELPAAAAFQSQRLRDIDRTSVVEGKSVSVHVVLGGCLCSNKK